MTLGDAPSDPLSDALQLTLLAHTTAQAHLAKRMGVSRADVDALEHLMVGALSASELADRLGLSLGAVTHLLGRLEQRDHARRTPDAHDRRKVAIELTERGRQTVLDHVSPMLDQLDELARHLDEQQTAGTLAYLRGSGSALESLGSDPSSTHHS